MAHLKLVCTAILLGLATCVFSQQVEHISVDKPAYTGLELIAGHGFFPSGQMFAGMANHTVYKNDHVTGALSLTCRYPVSRVVALGIAAAYEQESGTWQSRHQILGNFLNPYQFGSGAFIRKSFTVAAEGKFSYTGQSLNGLVDLYCVIGLGYTRRNQVAHNEHAGSSYSYETQHLKPLHFNAYLCPVGIRFGKALSGFVELGLGYKGFLNYGAMYRF